MSDRLKNWLSVVTLGLVALAAGVGWRVELEWRGGWGGLAWIHYYHWAVPLGALAFCVWAVCVAPVRRRVGFALALLVFAAGAYCAVDFLVHLYFVPMGTAATNLILWLSDGDLNQGMRAYAMWCRWVVPGLWALIPLAFCVFCRAFGAPISLWVALFSAVLFLVSWPLAICVRESFERHHGQEDLIHALKSGFVVPFLVVALGLPLLPPFHRRSLSGNAVSPN